MNGLTISLSSILKNQITSVWPFYPRGKYVGNCGWAGGRRRGSYLDSSASARTHLIVLTSVRQLNFTIFVLPATRLHPREAKKLPGDYRPVSLKIDTATETRTSEFWQRPRMKIVHRDHEPITPLGISPGRLQTKWRLGQDQAIYWSYEQGGDLGRCGLGLWQRVLWKGKNGL